MTHPTLQRRRPVTVLLAVLALAMSGLGLGQPLPDGWSSRHAEGGTLYEPDDLPQGSVFNLWVPAPLPVGQVSGSSAFLLVKQQGLRGLDTAEWQARCDEATESQGSVTQSCRLEASGRSPLHAQYVMLPVRNGVAHSIRVLTAGDPARLERHKAGFGSVMKLVTQRWANGSKDSAATAPSKPASPKEPDAQARHEAREAIARAVRTAPGQGLRPDDYEQVLFSWRQTYINGVQYVETIYLLMKDGSAYRDLFLPPEDFNAEASKRLQPERWVRWRKNGAAYEVRSGDKAPWQALKAWPAIPGKRDERLGNTYTHASYANYGGLGGYASTSSFVFQPDGRFEQVGYTSHATGAMQAANGHTSGSVTASSGKGTVSSTGITAGGVNGTTTPGSTDTPSVASATGRRRHDGAAHLGTYRIDGWAIELQRDNGEFDRGLFLYSSDKRQGVNIAGQAYSLQKKR